MPFAFAGCGAGAGFAVNPFGRVPCGFVCAGAGAGFGFGADSALPFGIVPLILLVQSGVVNVSVWRCNNCMYIMVLGTRLDILKAL